MRVRALLVVLLGIVGTVCVANEREADRGARPTATSTPRPPPGTSPSPISTEEPTKTLDPLALPSPPEPDPVRVGGGRLAPVYHRVPTDQKVVFVTVDDGWYRDPRVVRLVRKSGLRLNLFLLRTAATQDPDYFRSLQEEGAVVENHTNAHTVVRGLSYSNQKSIICRATTAMDILFDDRPTMFRPPRGEWDDTTRRAARACGITAIVIWSGIVVSGKLKGVPKGKLRPGEVLLLHFRESLYRNLQELVHKMREQGFASAVLEDYLVRA